jgi:chemotaxis-related protein WspB
MFVLTFQIGDDRLALDIQRVEEVIPRVHLRPVSGAAPGLAGVFIYRGEVVPVIDLHELAGAAPCPQHLSSRIILTRLRGAEQLDRLVGLLAARVDETRDFEPRGKALPGSSASGAVDLGPVCAVDDGVMRLFDPDRFLPAATWRRLFGVAQEEAP